MNKANWGMETSLYAFNAAISPDRAVTPTSHRFGGSMALTFNTSGTGRGNFPAIRYVTKPAGGTQTACGLGQAAMGPFYCPNDKTIYIDPAFFNELSQRFGAPGDFAAAYVIAHEVGHHVQDLEGTLDEAHNAQARSAKSQPATRIFQTPGNGTPLC